MLYSYLPDLVCHFQGMKAKPRFELKQLHNWTTTKLSIGEKLGSESIVIDWAKTSTVNVTSSSLFYRNAFTISTTQSLHSFLRLVNWEQGFITYDQWI